MKPLRLSATFIFCFCTLSTVSVVEGAHRIKRTETNPKSAHPNAKDQKAGFISSGPSNGDEKSSDSEQSADSTFQPFPVSTESEEETIEDISYLSSEFRNCLHTMLPSESYEKMNNRTVFVPMYNRSFDRSNYLIREGQLFLCAQDGFISDGPTNDSDSQQNNKTTFQPSPVSNETGAEATDDYSYLSAEFLNCLHINLPSDSYNEMNNDTVFVPMYHRSFDKSNYLIRDGLLFLCPVRVFQDYADEEKFSPEISTVSIVCVGISSVCIILHTIMFILVKRLRNLPGYVLLSLCVALLSAYVCSFIQYEISDHTDCMIIGMFLLYFFLSSFFWMNTMSYDVWRSIRMATTKFRLTADRPIMVRFARYSAYSWGLPLIIIISSIIVHNTSSNIKYKLIFNISTCWFAYKQALTVYFAIPLFVLLGMNGFFFISSLYMILKASMTKSASVTQTGSDLWSRLFLSLRLGSVMGFMWIFGLIAAFEEREWLWYLYSVCNALQGVFIFFSFTVSERTRKACKKAIQGRNCSVTPTQTSQSQQTTAI